MTIAPGDCRRSVAWAGLLCAVCVAMAGCGDPMMNSGVAHPGTQPGNQSDTKLPESGSVPVVGDAREKDPEAGQPAAGQPETARSRAFTVEGPEGAVRITFDDLDLMKLLSMDPVTPDCIERMPGWLKDLAGKTVRIRGFMKPSGV